jgi:tetratricopeptide (TPR) repeat protein
MLLRGNNFRSVLIMNFRCTRKGSDHEIRHQVRTIAEPPRWYRAFASRPQAWRSPRVAAPRTRRPARKAKSTTPRPKSGEQQHSGAFPDNDLANYAYAPAKAKHHDEALEVLNLMKNPNTAQALNYRGYATRHMGKLDEGIEYYLQSLKLDPHYAQVHEYLGEAHVIKGDLTSAKYNLVRSR